MNQEVEALAREERLNYFKDWRKRNPDKVKKHNSTYWRKKALKKLQSIEKGGDESCHGCEPSRE